jgi:hypothetical protein
MIRLIAYRYVTRKVNKVCSLGAAYRKERIFRKVSLRAEYKYNGTEIFQLLCNFEQCDKVLSACMCV